MFKIIRSNILIAYNSDADYSIALKFGTEFNHGTDGTLQMFKVKGQRSKVKVTG